MADGGDGAEHFAEEMVREREDVYTSLPQVQQGNAVIAGLQEAHRRMQV